MGSFMETMHDSPVQKVLQHQGKAWRFLCLIFQGVGTDLPCWTPWMMIIILSSHLSHCPYRTSSTAGELLWLET
jgi:hypothetical protein